MDHHTVLKPLQLWLACLKSSGGTAFGPLNTKKSDVLAQNVFSQKWIIIQLWLIQHGWTEWDNDEEAISSEVTSTDSATIQCLGDSNAENEDFSGVNENEKHIVDMVTMLDKYDPTVPTCDELLSPKKITFAPCEGQVPLSVFNDDNAEYLFFPTIFCGQRGQIIGSNLWMFAIVICASMIYPVWMSSVLPMSSGPLDLFLQSKSTKLVQLPVFDDSVLFLIMILLMANLKSHGVGLLSHPPPPQLWILLKNNSVWSWGEFVDQNLLVA